MLRYLKKIIVVTDVLEYFLQYITSFVANYRPACIGGTWRRPALHFHNDKLARHLLGLLCVVYVSTCQNDVNFIDAFY